MQLLELSKKYGIAVITISLFLILSFTTEGFFTERNIRNLLDQQSTILIAASFMTGGSLSTIRTHPVAWLFSLFVALLSSALSLSSAALLGFPAKYSLQHPLLVLLPERVYLRGVHESIEDAIDILILKSSLSQAVVSIN